MSDFSYSLQYSLWKHNWDSYLTWITQLKNVRAKQFNWERNLQQQTSPSFHTIMWFVDKAVFSLHCGLAIWEAWLGGIHKGQIPSKTSFICPFIYLFMNTSILHHNGAYESAFICQFKPKPIRKVENFSKTKEMVRVWIPMFKFEKYR